MRAHLGGFVLQVLLLLALFLSMIDIIFLFSGKIFWLEIIVVLGLVVLSAVSVGTRGSSGLLMVYGAALLNTIVLSSVAAEMFWLPLVLAAAGMVLSLLKKEDRREMSNVYVEEVKPESIGPEILAGVKEPMVESRVITPKKPAKRKKKRRKK